MLREAEASGLALDELSVLGVHRDPFRLDTPAKHRVGHWLGEQFNRLVPAGRTIHWRGFHYVLVSAGDVVKPNGRPYENSFKDATWLGEVAAKAARWLGYIDMDRLTDQRTDEPAIFRTPYERDERRPTGYVSASDGVSVPAELPFFLRFTEPLMDRARRYRPPEITSLLIFPADPPQPYAFVQFGEKSSLVPVLGPVSERMGADLYCGAGEISDIHLERMVRDAVEDGRTLVVFTFSDFDPAGYQMPVSIGRKLQAFKTWKYPALEFQVVPVALTAEQVARYDLPETPLKPGDKRASRWRERFGREQTEIDALAALRPGDLTRIAEEAFAPYLDRTMARRRIEAQTAWYRAARPLIEERMATVDAEALAQIQAETDAALARFNDAVEAAQAAMTEATEAANAAIDEQMREIEARQRELRERKGALDRELDALCGGIAAPPAPAPIEPVVDEKAQKPLIDSRWGFVAGTQALKARKAYEDGDEAADEE
jgi:hypothetical protein